MLKPQKICMMIDAWDPVVGGAQVHIKELVARLVKDHDCEIHLITRDLRGEKKRRPPRTEELMKGKFIVHRIGPRSKFGNVFARLWWCLSAGFYVRKLHLKNHFDLIHAHAFLSSYPARVARFLCGLPIAYTVHGTSLFYRKTGLQSWVEHRLLTHAKYERQITVAENFLDLKNVNKRISVVPNGIDLKKFDKVKVEKEADEIFRVLFVGRFDPIKGVDDLIRGVAELKEEGLTKELEIRLVGYGYEIKKLKKLVRELHLSRVVKFVGMQEGDELIEEYKKADVFVLPSHSEGQSLTLMEAAACKLPILATQVGDNEKIVKEDVNGYLVPSGHPSEIKHYLKRFLGNPHLRKMGDESRAILEELDLTWDSAAEKTYKIYEAVLRDLKGVPAHDKLKDLLKDPRMPHKIFGQLNKRAHLLRINLNRVKVEGPIPCSITVDFERNHGSKDQHGSLKPSVETCKKFLENFKDFSHQQEFKGTFFVQGNLVPHLADELKNFDEDGHELGLHGMYHGLWGDPKWFLNDRPLSKAEKMHFLEAALKNFEDADLTKPVSFRAPNLVMKDESYEVLSDYGFKYDSSYPTFAGGDPLPYETASIKGLPVSFDPIPHFTRAAAVFPVVKYFTMTTYHFLKLSDEELERICKMIFWMQKKSKVKPHLVLMMHSWEFEGSDIYNFCGGDNYSKFAKKFHFLQEKFGVKFLTFENLCKEVCT